MTRDRAFALSLVLLALAAFGLTAAGTKWQFALWPLLVLLPVLFGQMRMRS